MISVYIWGASIDVCFAYPAYDCLASQISTAPGSSTCSVELIWARDLLFCSYDFAFSNEIIDIIDPKAATYVAFIILSLGAVLRYLIVGVLPVVQYLMGKGSLQELKIKIYADDIGYAGSVAIAPFVCIIVGAITTTGAIIASGITVKVLLPLTGPAKRCMPI